MAKHPAKFIEACKRSKVDTDELAKQVCVFLHYLGCLDFCMFYEFVSAMKVAKH
jgi:hypothetical protein